MIFLNVCIRIIVFENVSNKYKLDIKLDLVFTILGEFLQIIKIDDYNFQIIIAPYFISPLPWTLYPYRTQS